MDARMQQIIEENGYLDPKEFPDGSVAVLHPLMFTVAILYDLNEYGYGDRWCFSSYEKAKNALDNWDGEGEPQGWHRHPPTGRRRDEHGNETINF